MLRPVKSSFSYLINCVIFKLIAVYMNGIVFCDTNQTRYEFMANQLFGNSSVVDIKQFTYEFNFSKTVNICDTIDCNTNNAFCELNQCLGMKTIGNVHYAITCIIVAGVVVLLMATVYACHKENKRSIRWRNAHNRCQQEREQMITLRILQSLSQNRTHSRYYPDIVPLRTLNDPPPPYQPHYTPPPAYRETYQPTTYVPIPK